MRSVHIDIILAAEVAAGRLPSNTVVGVGQDGETWCSAFVAFDKADGLPVVSEKTGRLKLNVRAQK